MKKFIYSAFLLFYCSVIYGQELPNIIPPSPTAFELTKYGNTEINDASGLVSQTIPVFNYNTNYLNLPISLSYSGAGIKVDQQSSWTGINWNLKAGGVITRVVRDQPDEYGLREMYTGAELSNFTNTSGGELTLLNLDKKTKDTQVDLFNFSFAGNSGSFFLNNNLEPELASYDKELVIEFVGGVQNNFEQIITITDENGIKYYFGGIGGAEQSRLFGSGGSASDKVTTAYYLYQILHPKGDIISLTYGTEATSYSIETSKAETLTINKIQTEDDTFSYSSNTIKNHIYNGKYLSKISSNRTAHEIHFQSTPYVNDHFNRVLNRIEIVEKDQLNNDSDFKVIDLSYISKNTLENSTRFFLNKVEFFNDNNQKLNDYSLEYNDINDLPVRLSYSKDNLGYYNGKSNSSNLPKNTNPYFQNVPLILANRESDFSYAVKGSLAKITYPTGGNTFFEYEGTQFKRYNYNEQSLTVYNNSSQLFPNNYPIPETKLIGSYFIGSEFNASYPYENQDVLFKINAIAQGPLNNHYRVHLRVKDESTLDPTQTYSFYLEYGVFNYNKEFTVNLLKDHSYSIKLELEVPFGSNSSPVDVNLNYKYIDGISIVNDLTGVRVKRVIDNPIGGNPIIRRYYYNKINEFNNLDFIPFAPLEFEVSNGFISSNESYFFFPKESCDLFGCFIVLEEVPGFQVHLKSESINSIFHEFGAFYYENVTISYGGDNFEKGGVENEYTNRRPSNGIGLFSSNNINLFGSSTLASKENNDIYNGSLVKKRYFKRYDDNLSLIKENNYSYSYDISSFWTNVTFQRLYPKRVRSVSALDGLYIGVYNTYINKLNLESQTETQYLDGVPLNDLDNSNFYRKITSTTNYTYKDNLVGLPSEIETINSNGDVFTTKNFYPVDVINTSFLGHNNLTLSEYNAIKTLQKSTTLNPTGQHQISKLIQKENFKNTELTSTLRTNFKNWGNNLILPEKIQTSKAGQGLDDRIVFYNYQSNGNPLEMSQKDGIKIYYVWGYNKTKPIAKIENYTTATTLQLDAMSQAIISSDLDVNTLTEDSLRDDLQLLRNAFPDSQVTTFTYDPLIGVTSITDPRGQTIYYSYDSFNRLQFVKDNEGNILSETEYNYKN